MSRTVRMENGDFVFVPSFALAEIYVLGEVTKPGPVPLQGGRLSLIAAIAAIAAAGGLDPATADVNVIRIFRGHGCSPQSFTVAACEPFAIGTGLDVHPGDRIVVAPRDLATLERPLPLVQPFVTAATTTAITALGIEAVLGN